MPKVYPRVQVYKFGHVWCTVPLKGYCQPADKPRRWTSYEEALTKGIEQAERIRAIRSTRGYM